MDFKGQRLAKIIIFVAMVISTIIGFLVGYYMGSFFYTFVIITIGCITVAIATIPNWQMYNKNPIQWTPISKHK
ncbi:microsomal signal peptidase protein, putative (SPC1) [Babesia microti strain RI]|uniref:Signal peptidase complex subunit 1 n=1 Tax=Babesia microti (strain RI) TaxID=1133968 RepID=A0A1R4AA77_BABMR|nr:microsomal signal peptidase protein, putative (SPC1) [Babesia microti strain RI]SJK85900.1 microsomal signal peptidase protein, putative (SPC1) [Babesia microti strain RI]|eukprot:XP_021338110.1 microsomal signal peptidase protein, putative (SPC1) [Babesia microti strain RI]